MPLLAFACPFITYFQGRTFQSGASLRESFADIDEHLREKRVAQATAFSLAVR